MIDLVYKIGTGCQIGNHDELRYSIRSAVRHLKDLRHIYIIGFKPNWVVGVKHILMSDPYTSNKDANLINKLIVASREEELSEKYLNMSDDYYFLKDVESKDFEIPVYDDNVFITIAKKIKGEIPIGVTKWERRVLATANVLKAKGFTSNCFETHMPVLIEKKLYARTVLNYDFGVENGYCGNTLYFNSIGSKSRNIEVNDLLRLTSRTEATDDIEKLASAKILFNYSVTACNKSVELFLSSKFNEKSIFEI